MSNWQKISLRDAVGKVIFDDEWGFIKFDGRITYSIGGQDISYYYFDSGSNKKQLTNNNIRDIFSKMLYYRNPYYGRYYGSDQEEYIKITVEEITVTINQNNRYGYSSNANRFSQQRSFVIKKQDKKRLEYLRYVWICDEIQDEKFNPDTFLKQPLFKDLKVDDEVLVNGKKHLIGIVYEQPNESGRMFYAKPNYEGAEDEAINVTFNDKVYVLPYKEQPTPETKQFNICKDEFVLSPYAVKTGQLLNVYWNKIDDASEYVVSLYKNFDRPYMQKVYHLKDYVVGRNDGFVSIDGLTDEGYIVTVKAENRSGEEIALSRGIDVKGNGRNVPQYWKE